MRYKYSKLYWFLKSFNWMRVYFSPFKPPIPKVYIGKVAVGTPYFLPRVWKKATPKRATEEALKQLKKIKEHNSKETTFKLREQSFSELYEQKLNSSFTQPKKIGFDFVDLGWKTKWTDTDYRFEWSPVWSFVFFGYQIAITFVAIEMHHFWECYLYYSRHTKGKTKDRLIQARKEFPCVWTSSKDGKVCYWDIVLRKKYIK